jgi:D-alanyl-D-alanine carboxypeptidase/D-alanyl-D-alanine-endopeptidase (penicillin-binding protein 4)
MTRNNRGYIASIVLGAAIVLVSALLAYSRLATPAGKSPEPQPVQSSPAAVVSGAAADVALAREIDRTIDQSDAAQARWGVFVASMKDGRVIHSRNGDRPFTPASNMKIFTTAIALDLLGQNYRWRTSVYAVNEISADGTIDGDLVLYGRGAPDFDSKRSDGLPALVDQLYRRGVRHVRGKIIGDQSYFRGELYGIGWQWNDLQWYFGAEPSALSIDENSVEVTIAPGGKTGDPAGVIITPNDNSLRLTNNTTTGDSDARTTIGIIRDLSGHDLRVWGEFPVRGRAFSAFLSIPNPALRAARLFRQALIARGIQVDGEPQVRDFRMPNREMFDPQKAHELAYTDSQTLDGIIRKTNKESNNLYAELVLRTLGKERGTTAPDPDPRKDRARGDDEAGVAVIKSWLNSHGITTRALAFHDGSGLSRLDLVTPESAVRLLIAIAKSDSGKVFQDSLPVAGRDGTLRGRMVSEAGRVFAKTGSLTYDNSLSGYVQTQTGEILVFSVLSNDAAGPVHPVRVIDEIVGLLAAYKTATL